MSEREDLDTDLTSYSLDDEDQLQPGDSLMGSGTADEDPLDAGYSPPDSARGSYAHGVTAAEQREGESIDQRLKQEEPDTTWEVDEPDRIGGDDPDAIAAEDDWIGDSEVGDARAGRRLAADDVLQVEAPGLVEHPVHPVRITEMSALLHPCTYGFVASVTGRDVP